VTAPDAASPVETPYVAVIFTSARSGGDTDRAYDETAVRMEELAARQPGYLGIESARGADGVGITVSYWTDESAARSWKSHTEHLAAQRAGREHWYAWYRVRVATVDRQYSYDADHVDQSHPAGHS
jgi:heme-degrading monooxygenase HmoA